MAIVEDLVVSEIGAFIGVHGQRLRVNYPDDVPHLDAPLLHLQSVQVHTRSASISTAAIAACCEAGIPIYFLDSMDGHYATIQASTLNTVIATRRRQLEAITNEIGVEVARQIGIGKLKSQARNLRYFARRQPEDMAASLKDRATDLVAYTEHLEKLTAHCMDDVRAVMMGYEGQCGRMYWEALSWLIPEEYGWKGRTGRHASDPVNVLLNYGYGILYGEVQNALVIAGLEPYAGLIHTDRPGKPSLTLDLIEEFRAPVVDRTVIGLVNRGYVVKFDENGRLEREFRKNYAEHILSRLSAQGTYNQKRYKLRSIIQLQARLLASALRGERAYESYTGG